MSAEVMTPTFQAVDYVVFVMTLAVSMGIGIFFAFKGNKNTDDFLLGGRSMSVLPVALSLLSSYISSVGILGGAGEVYGHGLELSMQIIGYVFGVTAAANIFLPVFYPLKMTSINEYIEMRFRSRNLRLLILVVNGWIFLVVSGLSLYAPTLALASVTPLSTDSYIIILGIICTIYSTIGGLKAVVWTDTFQMIVIIIGMVAVIIVGSMDVGGLVNVWTIGQKHRRTELFDMSVNIYERHNFPNVLTMSLVYSFAIYGAAQFTLQRACSVSTAKEAQMVYYFNMVGMVTCMILMYLGGLCAFASYAECDPISQGHIYTKDQILPYFVMDKMGFIYGMPGLFVATLISGTMSSLSSFINSLAAMVWSDGLKKIPYFARLPSKAAATVNKIVSMVVGLIMILLAFLSKKYGGLSQASITIVSIMGGPLIGLFSIGVFIPRCGHKGAWMGFLVSVSVMSWIAIGATVYKPRPELLSLSTEGCPPLDPTSLPASFNVTSSVNNLKGLNIIISHSYNHNNGSSNVTHNNTTSTAMQEDEDGNTESISEWPMMYLYGISYTLYTPLSWLICVTVALITTLITGSENYKDVRPELIAPIARRFLPKKEEKKTENSGVYYAEVKTFEYDLTDFSVPPPHLMSPTNPRRQLES